MGVGMGSMFSSGESRAARQVPASAQVPRPATADSAAGPSGAPRATRGFVTRDSAPRAAPGFLSLRTVPKVAVPEGDAAGRPKVTVPAAAAEQATARHFDLSAGAAAGGTVTVKRTTVDPGKDPVVISGARGVQIGDGNRMLNEHRFQVDKPTVSLSGLLDGNARAQKAFGRVVENPSRPAIDAFQKALKDGPVWTGGVVKADKLNAPGVRRIPIENGPGGPVVVDRSAAIQLGDGGTMRNQFEHRVAKPEFSAEAALRRDPDLVRSLATAVCNPEVKAVWRALGQQFDRTFGRFPGDVAELRGTYRGMFPAGVTGDGIQLGTGNIRIDTVQVEAHNFTVTGWEPPDPPRLLPEDPHAALAQAAAALTIEHTAPGRDYLVTRVADGLLSGLSSPPPTAGTGGDRLEVSLESAVGPTQQSAPPTQPGSQPRKPATGPPEVRVVTLGGSADDPGARRMGAVVWGSAAAIGTATGSRVLNADTLLRYARQRLRADLRHMPLKDVPAAFRALTELRAVAFLDPGTGRGLWVDADPGRPAPTARLIQLDLADGPPGRFSVCSPASPPASPEPLDVPGLSLSSPQPTTSGRQPAHPPSRAADRRTREILQALRPPRSLTQDPPNVAQQPGPASPTGPGGSSLGSL